MPVSKAVKGAIKSPAGKKFLAGVGASVVDEVLDNPVVSAAEGAVLGFAVGGPIGAAGGGIAGWYLADSNTVVPVDMIAIPAYQAYMIQGNPAFEIFIRSGETIVPTGGEVRDMEQAAFEAKAISDGIARMKKRKKGGGLPRKYAKMGFKKGWAAYKKTAAYKKKAAKKKKTTRRRKK
jgi:hypothetical protein